MSRKGQKVRLGTSAWIPPGLLPDASEDRNRYCREYHRLRLIYDPHYREQIRKKNREGARRRYHERKRKGKAR